MRPRVDARFDSDPVLAPLAAARSAAEREAALERLLVERAQPIIDRILRRAPFLGFSPQDVEDARSITLLRLIQRLDATSPLRPQPIRSFDDFVAVMAHHALDDLTRRRHPARATLKNRIRYTLLRNETFASWSDGHTTVGGLAAWRGRPAVADHRLLTRADATAVMLDASRSTQAIEAILSHVGAPLAIDDLVSLVANLWHLSTGPEQQASAMAAELLIDDRPGATAQMEWRQVLDGLWREIELLPMPHRAALLLHLRDSQRASVIPLLVFTGVCDLSAVAAAIGFSDQELRQIWDEMPLDDLRIAERLDLTRQKVINLRRTARERLKRWMTRS